MFAIAGGKGGCGKTTIALGIARALADAGRDPLVLDADVDMPDLHVRADVPPEPGADALADGARIECVRHRSPAHPGVSIVPAGATGTTATALDRLADWHGPVLVDCPAGASEDATLPLRACRASVLVTTDTPQSLGDARKTGDVAARLDAPVAATLIRGPDAADASPPVDCSRVERVGRVGDPVLADPRIRAACHSLATGLAATPVRNVDA